MQNSTVIITCPECISDLQISKKILNNPSAQIRCGGCDTLINCQEVYARQQNSIIPEASLVSHVEAQAKRENTLINRGGREDDIAHQPLQREYSQHHIPSRKKNFYLALFCLVLLVPIVVQLVWQSDYKLAKQKVIDPALGYVCQVFDFDCSSVLSADASLKLVGDFRIFDNGAVVFEGYLSNQASELKKFPRIKIVSSELSGQKIAIGIFNYRDYLNGVVAKDTMEANSNYAINLAVSFKNSLQFNQDKTNFEAKLLP